MRVVAGQWRGRKFEAPPGDATRPTADRVREAVFSMLGPLEGELVLDLYAGSGALGIEALSRGAARVTFVEKDARAAATIRDNLARLDAPPQKIVQADALRFLERADGEAYGLVFLDPPYSSAPALGDKLAELLPSVLFEDARVVTESDKRAPLVLPLPLERERTYGDTRITLHRDGS